MDKKSIIIALVLVFQSLAFSQEITSIKIELQTSFEEKKSIIVYDSKTSDKTYPFLIFKDCVTGWGKDNKKLNPLFVPKNLQPEGIYIIYVETESNKLTKKYRLMNFKAMQDVETGAYYETDFLQYLYEYFAGKYIQTLLDKSSNKSEKLFFCNEKFKIEIEIKNKEKIEKEVYKIKALVRVNNLSDFVYDFNLNNLKLQTSTDVSYQIYIDSIASRLIESKKLKPHMEYKENVYWIVDSNKDFEIQGISY